ncbi:MAG: hypothetical protein HYW16_00780 [Candidatus Rokubacteria bacterium]|nr:hypothetical protein [Candidatus Rokubacteria bacterium]
MKISYRWIKEYVETDLPARAIADRLTNAGIEVAEVAPLVTGLSGVVVGAVEAVDRHGVCRVATADRHFTVVCGAPNVVVGVRAAFAPPGATLPGQMIHAAKKRGVLSEGMLCSEKELGIGEDHHSSPGSRRAAGQRPRDLSGAGRLDSRGGGHPQPA